MTKFIIQNNNTKIVQFCFTPGHNLPKINTCDSIELTEYLIIVINLILIYNQVSRLIELNRQFFSVDFLPIQNNF